MTDDEVQQVRGTTGGTAVGSVPLLEFMREIDQRVEARFRAMVAESNTWRAAHDAKHSQEQLELTILKQSIDERTSSRQRSHEQVHQTETEHDEKMRLMHDDLHKALADQLRVADNERKARDAQQNEWRATLNDMAARLPSRDVTDALSDRITKLNEALDKSIRNIELQLANNAGRDRAFGMLMAVPGVLVAIIAIILVLTGT